MKPWFFLFIIPVLSFSQKKERFFLNEATPKVYFETAAQLGTIIKHSQKFEPEITQPTFTFESTIGFKSFGKKAWEQRMSYPETRVTFLYSKYGDSDVFGEGFALYPNVKFWIARLKPISFFVNPGAGIAWLNKPYNRISNPTNNVIGSKLNAIIQIKLGSEIRITNRANAIIGGAFTHYSNSKSQNPNLGINVGSLFVGFNYYPFKKTFNYLQSEIPKPSLRHEWLYKFSFGITEYGQAPGGPKFPVYLHTFQYTFKTSIINKVGGGITYSRNLAEYETLVFKDYKNGDIEKNIADDLSLFITDELLLGKIGVQFLVGAYLYDRWEKQAPVYAKIGVNYYYLNFGKNKEFGLFSGVNLKAHYSRAQFLEFGTGIRFSK